MDDNAELPAANGRFISMRAVSSLVRVNYRHLPGG
jgi:hypothetical protein